MTSGYYDRDDLRRFADIGEDAPDEAAKFFAYYEQATSGGALTEREKSLIALAVAHTEQCPYCIDAYTDKCLSLGVAREEMMEAVHVGAALKAGATLVHATQMRKILDRKEM
jgi:alkylhydroperoxidase/carboxymuconolactone decarboxylase family protein